MPTLVPITGFDLCSKRFEKTNHLITFTSVVCNLMVMLTVLVMIIVVCKLMSKLEFHFVGEANVVAQWPLTSFRPRETSNTMDAVDGIADIYVSLASQYFFYFFSSVSLLFHPLATILHGN